MKALLIKYKKVIQFVALFLGTYLILGILYSVYLNVSEKGAVFPDFITNLVAKQSAAVLETIGYSIFLVEDTIDRGMLIAIDGAYIVNIVEGCNAISVLILFVAFIIAFAETVKKTVLFLLAGSVLIYAINILRIVFLTIGLYKYPEFEKILHAVIFPAIIYGFVFILWMIWVQMLKPITAK